MKKLSILMLVFALFLAACGQKTEQSDNTEKTTNETTNSGETKEQSGKLSISTWGLGEDNLVKDVFKPFEEANGAQIVTEFATTSERLTKLKENPNLELDVIELNQASAAEANELGLLEKLDLSKLPNVANLIDPAKALAEEGYGVPFVINSVGIIYNPKGKLAEIKEWSDLWKSELENRIAVPDITTTFGPALVAIAGEVSGTTIEKDGGVKAFEKLTELKPNIVKAYAKSSDLAVMFANGEIDAAIVGDFAANIVKEALPEAVYVVPQSGTYANYNLVSIPKNSQNKDLAYKYLDYKISQELQLRTAASLNEAPTNKNVELSEELKANKTYGDIAERAKTIDFKVVNANLASWIDQFNRLLAQ